MILYRPTGVAEDLEALYDAIVDEIRVVASYKDGKRIERQPLLCH